SLARINPEAIFCQLDCFGGARRGPRSDYLGYDDLVQATTGIMPRFGGSIETPEEHAHVGTIDVMCGFGAATAVAAALYQKHRTGRIGRARTSLCALSGLAQMPFCYDYPNRPAFDEPSGPRAMGTDALHHLYRARDRWLMLAATEADLPRFARVPGLEGLAASSEHERGCLLASAIGTATAEDWVSRFRAADIGAAVCDSIETIRAANCRREDGTPGIDRGSYAFSAYPDHPSGHRVTQLDPYAVRPSIGRVCALAPAEKYGASTRSVLAAAGYSESEIDRLREKGAISESWSGEYLPS
ncbi:CoA transferase, partial [Amaricoccus solimangrovi]